MERAEHCSGAGQKTESEGAMTLTWTTKDGVKLKIREMETRHIQNCLCMLDRWCVDQKNRTVQAALGLPIFNGDAANDWADRTIEEALESKPEDFRPPVYAALAAELKRRQQP